MCKDIYAWNSILCACECDRNCIVVEYLKNYTCVKSNTDDLVITCKEILDALKTVFINFNDEAQYMK